MSLNLVEKVMRFDELGSTNDYSADLIRSGKVENGTVILSEYQTKGRGQSENSWTSSKSENLTFTVVFYPGLLLADKVFYLSMAVSLALFDELKRQLNDIKIKWPNDIYAGNRKIAGILIENFISSGRITGSALGVGLNVNQVEFPRFNYPATSLKLETGSAHDREPVFRSLLFSLDNCLQMVDSQEFGRLGERYNETLYLLNEWEYFLDGKYRLKARIKGVSEEGRLILENADGRLLTYGHGEIVFPVR